MSPVDSPGRGPLLRLDLLVAALLVAPIYLAASVGPVAVFAARHLWILAVVTLAQLGWTALEAFVGASPRERLSRLAVNVLLAALPAGLFWLTR